MSGASFLSSSFEDGDGSGERGKRSSKDFVQRGRDLMREQREKGISELVVRVVSEEERTRAKASWPRLLPSEVRSRRSNYNPIRQH